MKYTKNYQFKKPDGDDAYDIQNENDNKDLIDSILKNLKVYITKNKDFINVI